jgi:hypothetical protein
VELLARDIQNILTMSGEKSVTPTYQYFVLVAVTTVLSVRIGISERWEKVKNVLK